MMYIRPFNRSAESNHDYMTVVNHIYEFGFCKDYMGRIDPKWYFIVYGNEVKINTGTDRYDQVVSVCKDSSTIPQQVYYHGDVFYDPQYRRSVRVLKFESILAFLNAFDFVMDKEQHKVFEQLYMLELL